VRACALAPRCLPSSAMDAFAVPRDPVLGHELLSILRGMGGRARIEALREAAHRAFGPEAVYGNCHGDRFTFDAVLAFLESRGKLARVGDELSAGPVPACDGH